MIDINKFKQWLQARGAEILPITNEYESVRFQGREIGVLYKSGKVSGQYANNAINCFLHNKKWDGKPINVGRHKNYKKQKEKLIQRDGTDCFYCGFPLGEDITVEHLLALSSGGKNSLGNMVLCHEKCNQDVKNKTVVEKVRIAIMGRMRY